MSPATLSPPPVIEAPPTSTAAPPPPRLPQPVPLRRAPARESGLRLTRSAVLVSVAVHLVLGVLLVMGIDEAWDRDADQPARSATDQVSYLDVGQWPASTPSGGAAAGAGELTAAQAVTRAAIDSAISRLPELNRFPDRVPTRIPAAPAGAAPRAGVPGAAPAAPGAGAPAAGNGNGQGNTIPGDAAGGPYGPGYGDRRLIVTPEAVPEREKSEHERYMDHLNSRLGTLNDSAAAEAEHQRRIRNWTVKDRNGREWGIGEGGVPIIAGHRLPTHIAPPIYQGRDREDAERNAARQRTEIDRQADQGDRDRNFRERARATRERVDAERRRRRESAGDTARTSP